MAKEDPVSSPDLSLQHQRVDKLLSDVNIKIELLQTIVNGNFVLTPERDKYLARPPKLRYLTEFHHTIFDKQTALTYEGLWSDYHLWIAKKHGLIDSADFYSDQSAKRSLVPDKLPTTLRSGY